MATVVEDMTVAPLSAALGAEITGIDVRTMDDGQFERFRAVFHDNLMVAVRGQHLSPAEQTEFARRFGEIQYHISPEYLMQGQPEVMILSNEKVDGKNVGIPDAGSDWHSDHSYVDRPTAYTILQSVRVPEHGGDTAWTNMVRAFETLDDDIKARIEGLVAIHSFNRLRNPRIVVTGERHGNPEEYYKRSPPDAFHPLVRTHPFTGSKALYISPRFTIGIRDMDDAEAQPLLDLLFDHIDDRDLVYRHRWQDGDLVLRDNRTTLHLACGGVPELEIRRLHRTTVLGEIPF